MARGSGEIIRGLNPSDGLLDGSLTDLEVRVRRIVASAGLKACGYEFKAVSLIPYSVLPLDQVARH